MGVKNFFQKNKKLMKNQILTKIIEFLDRFNRKNNFFIEYFYHNL